MPVVASTGAARSRCTGRKPKGMQKQEESPRVLPRYATVAELGTQPAGWVGDRRRKADRGRRAGVEASSPILRPRQRGLQGASQCIARCGYVVRAGLLRRPLGLAVPVSERRSHTAPRKIQGGCGKKRAFYAVLVVDHFRELVSSFTMAIQFATRNDSHS